MCETDTFSGPVQFDYLKSKVYDFHGTKAYRGSRDIDPLILNFGIRSR
jgi:hypothetical protein